MYVIAMGYNGTGSSAITHLISEYSNASSGKLGTFEHVVFYIPHGLFDLEVALLQNNTLYRSDAALNDFFSAMKRLNDDDFNWFGSYQKRFGNQFMDIVNKFMDRLVQFTRQGSWFNDYRYKQSVEAIIKDTIKTVIRKPVADFGKRIDAIDDNIVRYSFVTEEEFYSAARDFVSDYLHMIEPDTSKLVVLDQLLLPHNLYRFDRFFGDDVRCIVIDRDPRDMFVLSKYVWSLKYNLSIFPDDVTKFSDFYRRLHMIEKPMVDKRILRLHFEDLIYNYDVAVRDIEKFIGVEYLGEHVNPKTKLNPDVSIKNTQNFRINKEWESEVKYLEKELGDMLYDFPYIITPRIEETSDPE